MIPSETQAAPETRELCRALEHAHIVVAGLPAENERQRRLIEHLHNHIAKLTDRGGSR